MYNFWGIAEEIRKARCGGQKLKWDLKEDWGLDGRGNKKKTFKMEGIENEFSRIFSLPDT